MFFPHYGGHVARSLACAWLQGGFVQSVIDATHERPWLWAVIIVVVVLPLVLIVVYCCVSTNKVSPPLIGHISPPCLEKDRLFIVVIRSVRPFRAT